MNQKLVVALAQMNVSPSPADNARYMIDEIKKAAERGVDVIVFPELCVPRYLIGDMSEDEWYVRDVIRCNEEIVAATAGTTIVVIFGSYAIDPDRVGEDGRLRKYNAGYVVQNGRLVENLAAASYFVKSLMPKYRMFDDERHFLSLQKLAFEEGLEPESLLKPFPVTIRGRSLLLGCMICEDMWDKDYALKPAEALASGEYDLDLLINISCSPWGWQKNRARHKVVQDLVKKIGVPFIYVNNAGTQNNLKSHIVFDGTSTVYNEAGDVAHFLPPFFEGVVDIDVTRGMCGIAYKEASDVDQLYAGLVRGLKDYFDGLPEHLRRAVVGVSGGIDSAVVAALCVKVLGPERVHAINMPYEGYSSQETRDIAQSIAEGLGISYEVIPITEHVDLKARAVGAIKGTAPFKTIQAIERMSTLSGVAGVRGAIFTCNGNKTETAFGFFTLNGDGRGSIAPLGDLLKGEVYQLAHRLNTVVFGREVIPQGALDIAPMDELSADGVRKDPFDYGRVLPDGTLVRGYHDEWVRAVVCFRKNPEWFLDRYLAGVLEVEMGLPEGKLAALFPTPMSFVEDLERCWELFFAAARKRAQSVPNFIVSKRAFGFDYRESDGPAYYTQRYEELWTAIESRR